MIFMGGGNPARIPEMEVVFNTQYKRLSESSERLYSTTGVYQSPQGELGFDAISPLAKVNLAGR